MGLPRPLRVFEIQVEELMRVISKSANSESVAARELRNTMRGPVVSWGDEDYARIRQIWNRAVESEPALLAVCETSADVQAAVRSASARDPLVGTWRGA
jgi:hypothetical protein